jgi:hypothetical protein
MQLGWIDFSKAERDKVLDVINLLQEEGAVDELGIGMIRDGFANIFFPGTSTIQTRAKYLLIVSYVLKEAADGKYGRDYNSIIKKIDDEERWCGNKLLESDKNGVIGARVLPNDWVARKPSNIYWNGIRTLGIFKDDTLSIPNYIKLVSVLRKQKENIKLGNHNDETDENEKDDKDAGNMASFQFWNLPNTYNVKWRENLTIWLLPEEAAFLREQIMKSIPNTLFSYLIKNQIDVERYDSFEGLTEDLKGKVNPDLEELMLLACDFNQLVYLSRVRYNVILSDGKNEAAIEEWEALKNGISSMNQIDLESIFAKLNVKNFRLKKFLFSIREGFATCSIEEVDQLIKKREIELKGQNRAKLNRIGEYPVDAWIGGGRLDYRFGDARKLIRDIYEGEGKMDV